MAFQSGVSAVVIARMVPVDYASHSAQVEVLEAELVAELEGIRPVAGRVPLYSTVTGDWLDMSEMDAGYWYRNLRATVRFEDAVRGLLADGHRAFVEVSPHPVLVPGLQDTLDDTPGGGVVLETLRRDSGDAFRLATALAHAHVNGLPVDWTTTYPADTAHQIPLPTYAFEHRHYWPRRRPAQEANAVAEVDGSAENGFWEAVEQEDLAALARVLELPGETSLGEALPRLASWRREQRERSTVDGWRYHVAWRPVQFGAGAALTGRWLLAVPAGRAADEWVNAVTQALTGAGAEAVRIDVPADATRESLGRAIAELSELSEGTAAVVNGVVSFAALLSGGDPDTSGLSAPVPAGVAANVALVQALGDADVQAPLWCVTRGAVSVGGSDEVTDTAQAGVWGLGRVVALEHPGRWGGLVDLPEAVDAAVAPRLVGLLAGAAGRTEDQVAIRPAGIFARRLVHAPAVESARERWQPSSGTVLVTGGTGGLGRETARWLAGAGAERLVLISRRGPDADGVAELRSELEELGSRVGVVACDVADRDELARLITELADEGTPVRGVVHTAGISHLTALTDIGMAEFAEVYRAKTVGARNLHELLGDSLDAFVTFSTISAVWGSGGQSAYAAANAEVDALMEYRRAAGLAATSVAWGAWAEVGMATTEGVAEQLGLRGIHAMPPHLAIAAMRDSLTAGDTCVTVSDMNWTRFAPSFAVARATRLLDELPEARKALAGDEPTAPTSGQSLSARLAGLAAEARADAVLDAVRAEVATVLGHTGPEAVEPDRPFLELGFDSLTAIQLRNALGTASGLKLPTSLVFDHATPAKLADFLGAELALLSAPQEPSPQAAEEAAAPDLLVSIFASSYAQGRSEEAFDLLRQAARLLPKSPEPALLADHTEPVRLATGAATAQLFCLPSHVPVAGPHQFARFAASFRGVRDVTALGLPGYRVGQTLPESAEILLEAQAERIRRQTEGAPFVLLGMSSGGYLAHALARHMEATGDAPAAVVLIDPYAPDDAALQNITDSLMSGIYEERNQGYVSMDGLRLSASSWYGDLLLDLEQQEVAAPTLLVRASDPLPGIAPDRGVDFWRTSWQWARTVVDVSGDHFTMMEGHADSTARAVNDWLDARLGAGPADGED